MISWNVKLVKVDVEDRHILAYLDEPISQSSALPVLLIGNMKRRGAPYASKANTIKNLFQHLCSVDPTREFWVRCKGTQELMSRLESHCILGRYENIVEDCNNGTTSMIVLADILS